MALAPKFKGLQFAPQGEARHTLEIYLDYVCPFSAKLFKTLNDKVCPLISSSPTYSSNLRIIFRPQIQPWHPSSTLAVEAALAVQRLAPDQFWAYSKALFEKQTDFFDVNVVNETRNQTYERLVKVVGESGVGGVDEGEMFEMLRIGDKPGPGGELNSGNKVTDEVKLITRAGRLVGNHVTPTVYFNGIEEKSISSSFTAEQWEEWLQKNVV